MQTGAGAPLGLLWARPRLLLWVLLLLLLLLWFVFLAAAARAPTMSASPGNIMENTPISRMRRQISWVYWEP